VSAAGPNAGARIPLAERIIGAVSAAVIVGLMAFLTVRALGNDGTPPDIVVEMHSVTQAGAGWLVEIAATNLGHTGATHLEIEGELPGTAGIERRSVVLDYVPPRSTRHGGLYFTGDPRARPLTLRAVGYQSP
jgi:uncharacterized protein (TIGR02588 family)